MNQRSGCAAALLVLACAPAWSAWGQAQVVRDRPQSSLVAPKDSEARALFLRMQSLERQVLSLQGRIEQLNNKIELVRAVQRDQLGQMERRLSLLNGNQEHASAAGGSADSDTAQSLYRNAHELMQQREFRQAKHDFEQYIDAYPKGDRLVDALFWLGELSLVVSPPEIKQAQQAFKRILDEYPDFQRVPTVLYKMAKIYHSQGNGIMARALLKQVIREHGESSSNAVELAQAYLTQNFPKDS